MVATCFIVRYATIRQNRRNGGGDIVAYGGTIEACAKRLVEWLTDYFTKHRDRTYVNITLEFPPTYYSAVYDFLREAGFKFRKLKNTPWSGKWRIKVFNPFSYREAEL